MMESGVGFSIEITNAGISRIMYIITHFKYHVPLPCSTADFQLNECIISPQ